VTAPRKGSGRPAARQPALPASPDAEAARRVGRFLARAAQAQRWNAAERADWETRAQAALGGTAAQAAKLARQVEALAKRLARTADVREARRAAALLWVRAERGRAAAPADLLAALVATLGKALAFDQATAFVYDARSGSLSPAAVEGAHVDLIPDVAFDHGAGFSSWVAKTRRPVLVSTCREDPELAASTRPACFLSVPLLAEGELCGVLNLAHRRPGAFTGADRDFVVLAGALAAVGLSRLLRPPVALAAAGDAPGLALSGGI
jgi:GAF domain-containing protein